MASKTTKYPQLPKYVRPRKGKLHYQRDFPTALKALVGRKTFTFALNLPEGSQGAKVDAAVAKASEAYELRCKVAQNSDPNLYAEKEIDRLAVEILRAKGLREAQANMSTLDESLEAADHFLWEGYMGVRNAKAEMRSPTVYELAAERAYEKLVEKVSKPPKSLSDIWAEYLEEKGVDTSTREGKRQQQWFTKLLGVMGDHLIGSSDTLENIHRGLDEYTDLRVKQGIKGQSIAREISQPVAAFRKASKKHRLSWVIEPPVVKPTASAPKVVLTPDQQKELLRHIDSMAPDDPQVSLGAISLLLLQGGMMASEVAHLAPEDIHLDAETPHVIVRKGKTSARPRIIPVVLRPLWIQEHLGDAIAWLKTQTDSGWSHHLKKYIRTATGHPTITAHGAGRHTLKANAIYCGANMALVASIAGWSASGSGVSDVMMNYGASGLSSSQGLMALMTESEKIHGHLLGPTDSKVIPLRHSKASKAS